MRLIDKDALIETFKEKCGCECPVCAYVIGNCDGCELLTKAPEVEEIVRCRDCKYFQMHKYNDFHKRIWPENGDRWYECLHPDDDGEHGTRTRGPYWYCADGERK